jgi:anti-anti-sigma factor
VNVIRGDLPLDADHVEAVGSLLDECASSGRPCTVFDMEKVPLIDSAGLELLLDYGEEFQQLGGALKVGAPNALCGEIFSLTGVRDKLEIFADSMSAVGSFVR